MEKVCIFCGEHPISKNKEHVIPQWLIKHTGDPKRIALLGKSEEKKIQFPWISFVFPSCKQCNSDFATVESKVKPVLINLENERPVSHEDLNLFLDWLDKVRIGMWLGQAMLEKKGFTPNFYINQRVGNKDRLCLMYCSNGSRKGIGILGTNTMAFEHVPSCFGLRINNLIFLNYSKEFLLGKNLGFPYPNNYSYTDNFHVSVGQFLPGNRTITYPIIEGKIIKPAIKFYQTIVVGPHGIKKPLAGSGRKFLNDNCLTYTNYHIQSRVFVSDEQNDITGFWPRKQKLTFSFKKKMEDVLVDQAIAQIVLEHQNHSIEESIKHTSEMSEDKVDDFKNYYMQLKALNISHINPIKEELKDFYLEI